MSVTVNNSNVFIKVVSAKASVEQSIDIEFSLPDYCPEINKILKCFCDVSVMSKSVIQNSAELGGQVSVCLLYEDADFKVNTFNYVSPFTKLVDLKGASEGDDLLVTARPGLINTKASGPRKIEIHGSAMLNITAIRITETKVINSISDDYICQKTNEYSYSRPHGFIEKNIYIEDDFNIGQTRPSIYKIIRTNVAPTVRELKQVGNKLIIKGDAKIDILYLSEQNNMPISITQNVEFSHVAETGSLPENAKCFASGNVLSSEFRPKASLDGENKIIAYEIKISVSVECYCDESISVVTDAFSCKYPAQAELNEISLEKYIMPLTENFVLKKNLDFSDGQLAELYDVFCDAKIDYFSVDGDVLNSKGVVTIFIFGRNSEREAVFIERNIDFEYRYEFLEIAGEITCEPKINVVAINFSKGISDDVDVAIELNINGNIFSKELVTALTDIKLDTENLLKEDSEIAAIIYFANGETVWEIAKHYGTSAQLICNLNGLENCDCVCNNKLLIPIV